VGQDFLKNSRHLSQTKGKKKQENTSKMHLQLNINNKHNQVFRVTKQVHFLPYAASKNLQSIWNLPLRKFFHAHLRKPTKIYSSVCFLPQCCETVMISCGFGYGSDFGKVSVRFRRRFQLSSAPGPAPDPDNI
jgi:hypothetical protein